MLPLMSHLICQWLMFGQSVACFDISQVPLRFSRPLFLVYLTALPQLVHTLN